MPPHEQQDEQQRKPECAYCQGTGWFYTMCEEDASGQKHWSGYRVCRCEAGRALRDKRNKALMDRSSLPPLYRSWSFKTYMDLDLTTSQQGACIDVEEYIEAGSLENKRGLYLVGDVGLGKSGLAASALNASIEAGNLSLYINVPDLLDHLRAGFDSDGDSMEARLAEVKTVELLVLDDIGTERLTAWGIEKLFQIIDYRVNHFLRTIFTSNLPIDELTAVMETVGHYTGRRVADRIKQHTVEIELTGDSLR